jgi:hypothetical protein
MNMLPILLLVLLRDKDSSSDPIADPLVLVALLAAMQSGSFSAGGADNDQMGMGQGGMGIPFTTALLVKLLEKKPGGGEE